MDWIPPTTTSITQNGRSRDGTVGDAGSDTARDVRDFLDNENARRGNVMRLTKVSRLGHLANQHGTFETVFILDVIIVICPGRSGENESANRRRLDRFIVRLCSRTVSRSCASVYTYMHGCLRTCVCVCVCAWACVCVFIARADVKRQKETVVNW